MNLKEQKAVKLESNTIIFIQENTFENVCKIAAFLSLPHCAKYIVLDETPVLVWWRFDVTVLQYWVPNISLSLDYESCSFVFAM